MMALLNLKAVLIVIIYVCTTVNGCSLSNIQLQQNFNPQQFSGMWHTAAYSRMMEPPGLPRGIRLQFSNPQHMKSYFQIGNDGNGEVKTTGKYSLSFRRRVHFICMNVKGTISTNTQAKLSLTFTSRNSRTSTIDYWVVKTDYTNYAITYTCLEEQNGQCTDGYMWVLTRNANQISNLGLQSEIDNAKTMLCINEDLTYPSNEGNTCNLNVNNFKEGMRRPAGSRRG